MTLLSVQVFVMGFTGKTSFSVYSFASPKNDARFSACHLPPINEKSC